MTMHQVKSIVAIVFVVVGVAVMTMTMGSGQGAGPLLPTAIPYLGAPFGLGLLAAQIAFCLLCLGSRGHRGSRGLIWIAVVWVIAVPLAMMGNAMNLYPEAMGGWDKLITAPACGSAIALGIGVMRDAL